MDLNDVEVYDRLSSVVSGVGTAKDKRTGTVFTSVLLAQNDLERMAEGDWLSRKIVDIVPHDMTREWRDWQASEPQIELLEATEKRLKLKAKVRRALELARLYGGSAIYIGTRSGLVSSELRPEMISTDGVEFLHVLAQHELKVEEYDRDLLSPYFGEPLYYSYASNGAQAIRIHRSRIIPFVGTPIAGVQRDRQAWGSSILQAMYDALINAGLVMEHVASLVPEMKVDVISVPGLTDAISTPEGASRLITRFALANTMKSTQNTLLLEGGEDGAAEKWDTKQLSLGGMPELIKAYLEIASGAADIPLVRLLNQSPGGLNATGDAEIRIYYDHVSSRQENELGPTLEPLDELIIRSALGNRPKEVHSLWAPLWQLSETELATIAKTKAETTQIYVDTGLFAQEAMAEAVKNQLVEDGTYPGLEAAIAAAPEVDFEAEAQAEKDFEMAKIEAKAKQAPALPQPKAA